jgi:hypothetical protein
MARMITNKDLETVILSATKDPVIRKEYVPSRDWILRYAQNEKPWGLALNPCHP